MMNKYVENKPNTFLDSRYGKATKQKGIVLVVSLVFLVALTAVAAALMQNTTTDMKMAGASNEKVIATEEAISAIDEIINYQLSVRAINVFTQDLNNVATYSSADLLPVATKTGASASSRVIANPFLDTLKCPRARPGEANSDGTIDCNYLQLQIQRPYGRNKTSNVLVDADIAQQLIAINSN